jgi:hypothetical protein
MEIPEEENEDDGDIASLISGGASPIALPGLPKPNLMDISKSSDGDIAEAMGFSRSRILGNVRDQAEGRPGFSGQADAYRKGYEKAMAGYQSQVAKYTAAQAKAQVAQAKLQADPRYMAQQFYHKAGDLNSAIAIAKSKGSALFELGQEVDLGNTGLFAIAPKGSIPTQDEKGNPIRVPTRYYAQKMGINVVPFTSGDENADAFRSTLNDSQRLMGLLDRLEVLYEQSGYIGKLSPTIRSAEAEAIEGQLLTGVLKTLNGTKSLSGVSEGEMKSVMSSIPQAASTWVTNGRGNETVKINKLRNDLTNVIFRAADSNGIALIPMKRQAPATREGGKTPPPSGVSL